MDYRRRNPGGVDDDQVGYRHSSVVLERWMTVTFEIYT